MKLDMPALMDGDLVMISSGTIRSDQWLYSRSESVVSSPSKVLHPKYCLAI